MDYFIRFLVKLSLTKLDVYIEPKIPFYIYPVVVLIGIVIYIAVQFVYSKKISKMNMVEGLKNILWLNWKRNIKNIGKLWYNIS